MQWRRGVGQALSSVCVTLPCVGGGRCPDATGACGCDTLWSLVATATLTGSAIPALSTSRCTTGSDTTTWGLRLPASPAHHTQHAEHEGSGGSSRSMQQQQHRRRRRSSGGEGDASCKRPALLPRSAQQAGHHALAWHLVPPATQPRPPSPFTHLARHAAQATPPEACSLRPPHHHLPQRCPMSAAPAVAAAAGERPPHPQHAQQQPAGPPDPHASGNDVALSCGMDGAAAAAAAAAGSLNDGDGSTHQGQQQRPGTAAPPRPSPAASAPGVGSDAQGSGVPQQQQAPRPHISGALGPCMRVAARVRAAFPSAQHVTVRVGPAWRCPDLGSSDSGGLQPGAGVPRLPAPLGKPGAHGPGAHGVAILGCERAAAAPPAPPLPQQPHPPPQQRRQHHGRRVAGGSPTPVPTILETQVWRIRKE